MAKLFLSYCHADENYCDMLQKHLAALKHQRLVETWHDRRIKSGDEFENAIATQLESADVILLLISSDFIASRYCYEIEMARAMERHADGTARVIPIILRPCDWTATPFGKLLAAPKNAKPVKSWPDIDEAFLDVVKQIRSAISDLGIKPTSPALAPNVDPAKFAPLIDTPRSANLTVRKAFTEADKDEFLEQSYAFMAAYFENSLAELQDRNPTLSTRYKRDDANRFTAVIYRDGTSVARCKISLGGMFGNAISYSHNDQASDNSLNESMSVEYDDQHIYLKAMGMGFTHGHRDRKLTPEGASEFYWSLLIAPLQ